METPNDSIDTQDAIDARAALDDIAERRRKKSDALAYLAGALQYHVDMGEKVSPEKIKRTFNDACDDAGVENLEIE